MELYGYIDSDGDVWLRQPGGRFKFNGYESRGRDDLEAEYGPLKALYIGEAPQPAPDANAVLSALKDAAERRRDNYWQGDPEYQMCDLVLGIVEAAQQEVAQQ